MMKNFFTILFSVGLLLGWQTSWAQPANDMCAGAIPITPSAQGTGCGTATFTLPFTTDGTTDSGVPTVCSTPGNDQWFTWTATSLGLTFSSQNPGSPGIAVFANCADAAAGTDIACLGTFANGNLSGWAMGDALIIQIYDFSGSSSDVAFCLEEYTPPPPPANDDCTGAVALTVNTDLSCASVTPGTIAAATASPEDATVCSGTEDDDVWFTFVATATSHEIDLINIAGGTTDLYHSLWEGTCGALTHQGLCSDPNSSTASGLTIGATYHLRVYSWTSTSGQTTNFDVCIGTLPPPPSNDACAGAISVGAGMGVATGSTSPATNVEGLTPCSGNASPCATPAGGTGGIDFGAGLWYVYTSGAAEEFVVDTDGSTFDTEVQVFTGSCGALVCVGGDDDSGAGTQSSICITSTASFAPVDYYIYIDGHGTANGNFVLNITADPLPVTLISFEGEKMDKANKLSWVTGSEANTEAHVIERSFDGNRWSEIGKVEASGYSSAEQSYEFLDQDPLAKSFYRVKSVDFDGSFQLSNVVTIEREVDGFSLSRVFPVPVSNDLNVEFNSDRNTDVDVTITDLMGRVIHTDVFNAADGTNNYQLDASSFASGVYFVSLSNGTEQLTQRIVKN